MKIELNENKVYFNNGTVKKEIHPFWLRERVNGEEFLDKGTQQRLFDPTSLDSEILINKANINNKFLEIDFNDGVNSKLDIDKLALEFLNEDIIIKSIPKIAILGIFNAEYRFISFLSSTEVCLFCRLQ